MTLFGKTKTRREGLKTKTLTQDDETETSTQIANVDIDTSYDLNVTLTHFNVSNLADCCQMITNTIDTVGAASNCQCT